MNDIPITANWGALPPGYKPSDWQDLVTKLDAIFSAYLPGSYKPVNYGSTTPAAEDQDRPWVRTNGDGSPDRTYVFFNGKWVARHPVDPASDERRMWVGTEAALRSHDGGDGTADVPTATTGAMWEIDTAFEGKFPVGVGAFAASGSVSVTGSTTSTAVSGEDQHVLTAAEGPAHTHFLFNGQTATSLANDVQTDESADYKLDTGTSHSGEYEIQGRTASGDPASVGLSSESGGDTAHNNLPPFYGVYVVKRTARYFFTP